MTTSEIQKTQAELKEWIENLHDESLLEFLHSVKVSSSAQEKDWWDELSNTEKDDLKAGINDYEKGKIYSSEEFWRKTE
tara:strand:- start:2788 stop:3024 length:237 start_codon:yes stop_codon:yes gene_type:complete